MKNIKYKLMAALFLNGTPLLTSASVKNVVGENRLSLISHLLSQKLIRKEKKLDEILIGLTSLGKSQLLNRFPTLNYYHSSLIDDKMGSLTLVSFNIPEEQRKLRDKTRYLLKNFGFGTLSRSLYASPHLSVNEVRRILESLAGGKTSDYFTVLTSSLETLNGENRQKLAESFNLTPVAEAYERALALYEIGRDAETVLAKFFDGFLFDPFLPLTLLPTGWPGGKAAKIAIERLRDWVNKPRDLG